MGINTCHLFTENIRFDIDTTKMTQSSFGFYASTAQNNPKREIMPLCTLFILSSSLPSCSCARPEHQLPRYLKAHTVILHKTPGYRIHLSRMTVVRRPPGSRGANRALNQSSCELLSWISHAHLRHFEHLRTKRRPISSGRVSSGSGSASWEPGMHYERLSCTSRSDDCGVRYGFGG